jgi:Xaa-Pro dipeptidase
VTPPSAERADRLAALRAAMREHGIDVLLLSAPESICHLTGLSHFGYFATTLAVVPPDGPVTLVARTMELPTLRAQVPDCRCETYDDGTDPVVPATLALAAAGGGIVGAELDSMSLPVRIWRAIDERLPGLRWVDASALVAEQRVVKSASELAHVRAAAAMSDRALQAGVAATSAGVTGQQLARAVYAALIEAGSEPPAFPPFIRISEDIPYEHVTWRAGRTLRAGDRVFFELGACAARYHAPLSRIVYVAEPPAGVARSADAVLAGLDAVVATLRPGTTGGAVYAAWHAAVAAVLGRDDYHRHHCGYLTGLGFPPTWTGGSSVTGLRRGSELPIRAGMVCHVMSWLIGQPGLPDYGVSDTAIVTEGGCELVTSTTRTPHVTPS